MKYDEEMGMRLKTLRERKDLSLRETAKRIQIDAGYLSRIEKGYIPSMQRLKTICNYYGVDVSYVLGENVDPPDEIKARINKWYSFIEESERKGYTPEEMEKILKSIEQIKGITDK